MARKQLGGLEPVSLIAATHRTHMHLTVITGPTASGKSAVAVEVARALDCDIISADSRQIYRGIPIITAAPTAEQLATVTHHLVGTLELDSYYSAARFEEDALHIIAHMERRGCRHVVVCGGSMMYVDALLHGLDKLPTISADVRARVLALYQQGGLEALRHTLSRLDPDYLRQADPANHRRLIHAIEISMEAGVPYSTLRTGTRRERPFTAAKFAISLPREELFARINARVVQMDAAGMEQEARAVYHLRHLNSLNTVGFKEMFAYFDGTMDRATALARLAKNTRVYAKKQLTWLQRDPSVTWLPAPHILPAALSAARQAAL